MGVVIDFISSRKDKLFQAKKNENNRSKDKLHWTRASCENDMPHKEKTKAITFAGNIW